jgi:hypothetical protein
VSSFQQQGDRFARHACEGVEITLCTAVSIQLNIVGNLPRIGALHRVRATGRSHTVASPYRRHAQ